MPLATIAQNTQIHLIVREGVNVFKYYLHKLEKQVVPSCIKHLTADNYTALGQQLGTKPMFSKYYLVYANVKENDTRYLEYLHKLALCKWIKLIITVRSRTIYDIVRCHPYFSSFEVLDCYNVTTKVMERYIANELINYGCNPAYVTQTAVTRIRRRAKYKAYVLDSVLPLLANTNLSKKVVDSYISPYTGVSLQNIGSQFFNPDKSAVIASYLYRYRKYISNIYKQVSSYLEKWFKLYDEYIAGALCEETVIAWVENSGSKFEITQEYQARKWLNSFSSYSYDFMLSAYIMLIENASANNNQQLSTLYKIYRMVNCNGN